MTSPSIADMRAALGLGPDVSDAAVVDAYVVSLGFGTAPAATPTPRDPWAMAAAAIFRASGSMAAVYTPAGGSPVPTRAIRATPPQRRVNDRTNTVLVADNLFQLPFADVPSPADGDSVTIADPARPQLELAIYGQPVLDVEGTAWTCALEPA